MSEERMLRLSEHEFEILSNFWSAARKERFHEDERPTRYEHQTVVIPLERRIYEGFQKLEPAPPKDWKPWCYRGLANSSLLIGNPEGECLGCPWKFGCGSQNTQNNDKEL